MIGRPSVTEAELQARSLKVLAYIAAYIAENGWAPTTREIYAEAGVPRHTKSNECHVQEFLNRLASQGLLKRGVGARTLALTDKGKARLKELEAA